MEPASLTGDDVVSMISDVLLRDGVRISGGPDENIDEMFVMPIDQRCHTMAVQIIQSSANQRKALRGKIFYVRRKIQFAVKPRLHRVLVGRYDVGKMVCHQRTHMACHD